MTINGRQYKKAFDGIISLFEIYLITALFAAFISLSLFGLFSLLEWLS